MNLLKHLPRKLSSPMKQKAVSLLELKANKKIGQANTYSGIGKCLKDSSNLPAFLLQLINHPNAVVEMLIGKYGELIKAVLAISLDI